MKKVFKFFLILICLSIISFSPVYAVGINMDLNNNVENNTNNITVTSSTPNSPTKVSTSQTTEDFRLTVSDIIDIILISVGIVLIFLAIAILIRIR